MCCVSNWISLQRVSITRLELLERVQLKSVAEMCWKSASFKCWALPSTCCVSTLLCSFGASPCALHLTHHGAVVYRLSFEAAFPSQSPIYESTERADCRGWPVLRPLTRQSAARVPVHLTSEWIICIQSAHNSDDGGPGQETILVNILLK